MWSAAGINNDTCIGASDSISCRWEEAFDGPTQLLFDSIRRMNSVNVQRSLDDGANIDALIRLNGNKTVLHLAAALHTEDCLMMLLGHTRRPQLRVDANDQTPLHACAQSSATLISLTLLIAAYGLSPVTDHHGDTFLHCLMRNVYISEAELLEFVEWLIRQHGSVPLLNTINHQGETVVNVALKQKRFSGHFMRVLLGSGASEARDLCIIAQQRLLRQERGSRLAISTTEEKRWLRLHSSRAKNHARLLHFVAEFTRIRHMEEDGRRKLWLREHKERGDECVVALGDFIHALEMERRHRVAAMVTEKVLSPAVEAPLISLPPSESVAWKGDAVALSGPRSPIAVCDKTYAKTFHVEVDFENTVGPTRCTTRKEGEVKEEVEMEEEEEEEEKMIAAATSWICVAHQGHKMWKLRALHMMEWLREVEVETSKAVACIQAHARCCLSRRSYKRLRESILRIQRWWREAVGRRREKRRTSFLGSLMSAPMPSC